MLKSATGDSAEFVTTGISFLNCKVDGQDRYLLEIAEGIPIGQALRQASYILYAAQLTHADLNNNHDHGPNAYWALHFQMESVRALLESVIQSVKD